MTSSAAEEKREEGRKEKDRKEAELAMLKKVMGSSAGEKKGFEIKHAALGRATQRAGEDESSKKKKVSGWAADHRNLCSRGFCRGVSEGGGVMWCVLQGKKRKGGEEEEEQEDNFKLNVDDKRFKEVYSNPNFALDPTDPNFRKTPGLKKILEAGRTKRAKGDAGPPPEEGGGKGGGKEAGGKEAGGKGKRDVELAALVTSLKGKKWGAGK